MTIDLKIDVKTIEENLGLRLIDTDQDGLISVGDGLHKAGNESERGRLKVLTESDMESVQNLQTLLSEVSGKKVLFSSAVAPNKNIWTYMFFGTSSKLEGAVFLEDSSTNANADDIAIKIDDPRLKGLAAYQTPPTDDRTCAPQHALLGDETAGTARSELVVSLECYKQQMEDIDLWFANNTLLEEYVLSREKLDSDFAAGSLTFAGLREYLSIFERAQSIFSETTKKEDFTSEE